MAMFITSDTHGDFTRFKKEVFYELAEKPSETVFDTTYTNPFRKVPGAPAPVRGSSQTPR